MATEGEKLATQAIDAFLGSQRNITQRLVELARDRALGGIRERALWAAAEGQKISVALVMQWCVEVEERMEREDGEES